MTNRNKYGTRANHSANILPYVAIVAVSGIIIAAWFLSGVGVL